MQEYIPYTVQEINANMHVIDPIITKTSVAVASSGI
jgi:hypothetical protein